MSDVSKDTEASAEALSPQPTPEKLSPKGMTAMQGNEAMDSSKVLEPASSQMTINASEFKPETKKTLEVQGLSDADMVLADNSGQKAEETARVVLKHEGLPDGSGGAQPLKEVVSGHYDDTGHGLDLIGVTSEGRPIPIEVKKRAAPKSDSVGEDSVPEDKLEPETLTLKEDILREREVNPALHGKTEELAATGEPDPDLSTDQMAGLWTRDRWIKLIKNDERRSELAQAGVSEEFLNMDNYRVADSPHWQAILNGRTTVIVSGNKDDVTDTLMREAVFKRGFDVAVINLKE